MQAFMPARGTHKMMTAVSVVTGDGALTESMLNKSVCTEKGLMIASQQWQFAKEENISNESKTCFKLVRYMELITCFVYGPLCVCFQSSDREVRRLSEQLSQRDEVLQKLEQEREHLEQLGQVRHTMIMCFIDKHRPRLYSLRSSPSL